MSERGTRSGVVRRAALAAAIGLCLLPLARAAEKADARPGVGEYELKAAFLYSFAKFVDWAPEGFPAADAPFRLCVVGDDPFGGTLDATLDGKTVNGHTIAVVRAPALADDGRGCHVLFLGPSEARRGEGWLGRVPPGVLTVGDYAGFARQGGMIGFVMDGAKVRFEINLEAADRGHMHISSKLLKLARIVKSARAAAPGGAWGGQAAP